MHRWGGDFKYFGDVSEAADEIGEFCRLWGRINVTQTKEKYGTVRVYCSLGWYQLHSITHPGYVYSHYPDWLWKLDVMLVSKVFSLIRLNMIVVPFQGFIYRLAYKRALKKYPHIHAEILDCADWGEYLRGL